MQKKVSAGFLVINTPTQEILACHPTGRAYGKHCYDIPKGGCNDGESYVQTACRELKEETGLEHPNGNVVVKLGYFNYLPDKDLVLYVYDLNVPDTASILPTLKCSSLFTDMKSGQKLFEMDGFTFTKDTSLFFKSLQPIIDDCLYELWSD